MGVSLWPAIGGDETDRFGFSEYHGHGSKTGMFAFRRGRYKLCTSWICRRCSIWRSIRAKPTIGTAKAARRPRLSKRNCARGPGSGSGEGRSTGADRALIEACLSKGNYLNNPVPGKEPVVRFRRQGMTTLRKVLWM